MRVTLLLYAYCMGVYSSRRIQKRCERDAACRVIVGEDVPHFRTISDFRKDPMAALQGLFEEIGALDADAGYYSEDNVSYLEREVIDAYIATERLKHHEKVVCESEGPIPEGLTPKEQMARKLRTKTGRETYGKRKGMVEPVFGQIKQARGFRQFLLRGLEKMRAEWRLICMTHNLKKLFGSGRWAPA